MQIASILILAGGQSNRMGKPKVLLTLPDNQTLLDFHVKQVKYLAKPILIADNNKRFYQKSDAIVIADYLPSNDQGQGAGPLSAIAAALSLLPQDGYALVMSCDHLLDATQLIDALSSTTAQVAYLSADKDYPLLGIYHRSIYPSLIQFLASGGRSVMSFLASVDCQKMSMVGDWEILANFNTISEFQQALFLKYANT